MAEQTKTVQIKIKRSSSSGGAERYDTFEVPFEEKMSVFNALEHIGNHLDPSLAFYASCRIGKCLGCMMLINRRRRLACTTLVEGDLVLEPDDRYPVVRDLVVDLGAF
jgi:fumarate reductase iron-sulfur subunit